MRFSLQIPTIVILTFLTACNPGDLLPRKQDPKPKEVETNPQPFPFSRKITDNSGRSIDTTILGKGNGEIAFQKNSNQQYFIVRLDQLSEIDQAHLKTLPDGGIIGKIRNAKQRELKFANRNARWHSQVDIAQTEAKKLGLPLLLTVLVSGNDASTELEKELLFSREFKQFANKNLVLAILKVDDPAGKLTTSSSTEEKRKIAAAYGVSEYSSPTVILFNPNSGRRVSIPTAQMLIPSRAIETIKRKMYSH